MTEENLLAIGFCKSEFKDSDCHYIQFSKFVNGVEIQVTHEVEGCVISNCYTEIGIEMSYRKLPSVTEIEHIKQLQAILGEPEKKHNKAVIQKQTSLFV